MAIAPGTGTLISTNAFSDLSTNAFSDRPSAGRMAWYELGLELGRRNRDEQIPDRLQGGIISCLIAFIRGLSDRGGSFLGRNSAGPEHIIRDLLTANSPGVALIVVRVTENASGNTPVELQISSMLCDISVLPLWPLWL
jgi:hypothetical protein